MITSCCFLLLHKSKLEHGTHIDRLFNCYQSRPFPILDRDYRMTPVWCVCENGVFKFFSKEPACNAVFHVFSKSCFHFRIHTRLSCLSKRLSLQKIIDRFFVCRCYFFFILLFLHLAGLLTTIKTCHLTSV